MSTPENSSGQESADQKTARERTERWDREIHESGHPYSPSPATAIRRQAEITRDREQRDATATPSERTQTAKESD